MEWNNNNKACVSTWFYLRQTKQLQSNFGKSANIKMNQLRYWNEESADATEASARAWSEWFVSYATTKDGAQYEDGNNWASTVSAMVKTMTNGENTVSDLAETIDEAIFFYKEVKK